MSLAELTRNCFQSGISSSKWLSLCKLLISKEHIVHDSTTVETDLSNSVLVLYRSYPGDPDLQDYLKYAIQDGPLSVAVFVATLLQAARSPELHAPTTLDTLCRLALDAHYASGLPPVGSVVPYGESPITVLGTVQDALALLRTAHSLPISPNHQLTISASELVMLLLSCVSDISQVSTAQAMVHFADANSLLQNFRLAANVRQVLETFVLSLSLLLGDDAKAAREAQIMHTLQLALGKGDILGASSNTDIITFSLIFHHMISYRAQDFGSGDGSGSVALLVGLFRWMSWSPSVFCTQLFISASTCMLHSHGNALIWKSFIVSRLPRLLISFENAVNADGVSQADWRRAIQDALLAASRRTDLITQCDQVLSIADGSVMPHEETLRSFYRDLLQYATQIELIDVSFAVEGDPLISNYNMPGIYGEARDAGLDLESYIETKITHDTSVEDLQSWIDRIWRDAGSHNAFADVALRRFANFAAVFDVESLSHLCRLLYTYEAALDILAIHVKICDIIFRALLFLEQYDCETVGDPQTAVTHLGDVVLFVQYTISRFHLETHPFTLEGRTLSASYLTANDIVYSVEKLSGDDAVAFGAWFKALFDSNSEGIEDSILRSTQPRTLLRISATLFSQAIQARLAQQIDGDVLNNGVSYFTSPLLNWTLVGVVKALAREIQLRGFSAPIHFEILQTLLLSSYCPRPVLSLCSPRILTLFNDKNAKTRSLPPGIDVPSVRHVVGKALGLKNDTNPLRQDSLSVRTHSENEPRQSIQTALAMARSGKAPALYVERCIRIMPPSRFLHLLWSELVVSASLGEMESCRRIATFVLTMPRAASTPPLLPIFLFIVSPTLIAAIDHLQPPEQTVNLELLVAIISSVLTAALHVELAIRSVMGEHSSVLGQPSAAIARRFAAELRERKNSHTSVTVLQRLASSQSFVANFPVFMNELG